MAISNQEIQDDVFEGLLETRIGEMGGVDIAPTIPMNPVKLDKIKSKDDDPKFVVVEIESGVSGNRRNWKPEILRKIVEDCNKKNPGGHLGHPFLVDPKTYDAGFPKPEVIWLGASYEDKGAGKATAKFKGYVLKGSSAREYLELGLIDGVSVFGDSKMKPTRDGYDVMDFTLETIDFARQGTSGMKSRVVSLAGEQSTRGGNVVDAKDIAALSEDEIRTHAPLLVQEIERKAVDPLNQKIGESVAAAEALKPDMELLENIKTALKLSDGENPLEKVTALIEKIENVSATQIKDFIKEMIGKKAKSTRAQELVNRLVGEMHTEYDGVLDDELKAKIEADFTAKIEGDDLIKSVIGEMSPGDERGRGAGATLGGRSKAGAEHGRGNTGDGVVKTNENITVRKRRVA